MVVIVVVFVVVVVVVFNVHGCLYAKLQAAAAVAQAPQAGALLGGELEHEGLAGGGAWGSQPETATEQ